MFENVLSQGAARDIAAALKRGTLPNALLFTGERSSGKCTAALELARVLSCRAEGARGRWDCACPSCERHRQLVSPDVLIAGERPCFPEIAAARQALLAARQAEAPYTEAARFLFLRSARKLTARFSPELWADDDKAGKIAQFTAGIEEDLEALDPRREMPEAGKLEKITGSAAEACGKLESGFLYAALPVSHVRSIASWARRTAQDGKRTVIIENAEKMQEGARNALLKILEEPPENTVFVLTSANRQALMPTILSRVRAYRFDARTEAQQNDVLRRVFHTERGYPGIAAYLDTFLPALPEKAAAAGRAFLERAEAGAFAGAKALASDAGLDTPQLREAFFGGIIGLLRGRLAGGEGREAERAARYAALLAGAQSRITVYNLSVPAALEWLAAGIAGEAR